jgi:phage replication initiation protein
MGGKCVGRHNIPDLFRSSKSEGVSMPDSQDFSSHDDELSGGSDCDRGGAKRPPGSSTNDAPRVVTTGGKIRSKRHNDTKPLRDTDADTGEEVEIYLSTKCGIESVRVMDSNIHVSPKLALVDAVAVSLIPPTEELPELWAVDQLRQFLPIKNLQQRKGYSGFKFSAVWDSGAGLIAWGGKSQRGRMYISIQGQGCATIQDWKGFAQWLEDRMATIKRIDLAHDDFDGCITSITWAVEQYQSGGFNAGGRQPVHQVFGDWLSGDDSTEGRTFGVGRRSNGKFCRVYEKGKQQGDQQSGWVRVEVEWRAERRYIPYDVLTKPGMYLAGAYPCLSILSTEQERIRTTANSATISFDAAIKNAKQQTGKLINLMMHVYGGDYVEVVDQLRRDGIPARLEPFSHALKDSPELLDSSQPGSFADIRHGADKPSSSTQ